MTTSEPASRYDVVVAGARCAGASTALALARGGLRVLVVDPQRPGSDTLSTHALMRGAVEQLARWSLLEAVRAAGTPPIQATTFLYDDGSRAPHRVDVAIEPRGEVDALYAPRRTVLDPLLQGAAVAAGAEVHLGWAVTDVLVSGGRVHGVEISTPDGRKRRVHADLVVGADGVRSRVARLVRAGTVLEGRHAAAAVYRHVPAPGAHAYLWAYRPGATVGVIPTNHDEACVFVCVPPSALHAGRSRGLDTLHGDLLRSHVPGVADSLLACPSRSAARAFAGVRGFARNAAGPGWALVGDAAYFRDPITAHGITDALRESDLLASAILTGDPRAVEAYAIEMPERVRRFMELSDRIASFEWGLDEVASLHLELSREMRTLSRGPVAR